MYTYIYSKWKNNPPGYPVEYYSELDYQRYETRKVEVFTEGKLGFASRTEATHGTRLGIVPVPTLSEILSQPEFDTREISQQVFEQIWKLATTQR